jgi:hypothetical protein
MRFINALSVQDFNRSMEKINSTSIANVKKLLFKGSSSLMNKLKRLVSKVTTQTKSNEILVLFNGGLFINATINGSTGAKITHGNSVPERKPPKMSIGVN